jgi:hypothetical protein
VGSAKRWGRTLLQKNENAAPAQACVDDSFKSRGMVKDGSQSMTLSEILWLLMGLFLWINHFGSSMHRKRMKTIASIQVLAIKETFFY